MEDKINDNVIGASPILQFGFIHNETDDEIKAHIVAEASDDEEVDQSPLTPEEKALLAECESDINKGVLSFALVGQQLYVIKTKKLFREHIATFVGPTSTDSGSGGFMPIASLEPASASRI